MNARELMREFATSHRRVEEQIAKLQGNPRLATQVRRLEEMERAIRREMQQLAITAREHAPGAVRELAESGYRLGARQAGAAQVTDFSMINREAVEKFASGLTDDLLRATEGVTDSTRRLVRNVARDEGLRSMIEGGTARDAGRAMRDHLRANGVFAIRYADGSRHGLGEYSQMAIRTTTANAYNTSLVHGAQAEGTEFFEIFDGPDCGLEFHDDPELAAGLVVSAHTATSFPIAHPNCRRSFGARPDIKSQAEADAATPSVTEDQMAAQRAQDDARAQAAGRSRVDRKRGNRSGERGTPRGRPTREERIEQYRRRARGEQTPRAPEPERRVFRDFQTEAEIREWNDQHYSAWDASLTDDERDAFHNYTGPRGHDRINSALRNDEGFPQGAAELDSALAKAGGVPEDVRAYRAINSQEVTDMFDSGALRPGGVMTDKGYMSTTINEGFLEEHMAEGFGVNLRIHVPQGSNGAYIGNVARYGHEEAELLLGRNTSMRILRTTVDNDGVRWMDAEVITGGQ